MSRPQKSSAFGVRGAGGPGFLLVALGAFGLSTIGSQRIALIAVPVGIICLGLAVNGGPVVQRDPIPLTFAVISVFSALSALGPVYGVYGTTSWWVFAAAAITWLLLGIVWRAGTTTRRSRQRLFVLVLMASAVFGAVHVLAATDVGPDVFFLHEAAADAIATGSSPYGAAVEVPNGAPEGETFIVGYPYPPLTAVGYAIGSWIGDARWTSLVAWLVVLAIIGTPSLRDDETKMPLGVMIASAAIPGWPLVLSGGWSEPLSLALLATATAIWARPRLSGAGIGLFIGSKQYLLAATPVILANRIKDRWTRVLWAAVALVLSFTPIVVWGVSDFVDTAIRFHIDAPARPDGSSIVGFLALFDVDFVPPVWLVVGVVLAITVVLRRQVVDRTSFLGALGALLSVAMLLSTQAFSNYWFLIAGIAALAAATAKQTSEAPQLSRSAVASEVTSP